jgi:hypothetical protein
LSKDQYGTFPVVTLVHPLNGRFKNTLDKTRKFSLVHVMGVLILHAKTRPKASIRHDKNRGKVKYNRALEDVVPEQRVRKKFRKILS